MKTVTNFNKANKKQGMQSGIYLVEFLVVLGLASIIGSIAMMSMTKVKEIATKQEMALLKTVLVLDEIEKGVLPNNLNKLESYFDGPSYKKDSFQVNYIYSKSGRTLCTSSIDTDPGPGVTNYCVSF